MKKLILAAALGMAGVGAFALVPQGSTAHAEAPAEGTAMKLARVTLTREGYQEMIKQAAAGMVAGIKAQQPVLPADFAKKVEAVVGEALPYDEMLGFNAQVYGKHFSDPELEKLIEFYKTPVGSKLLMKQGAIVGEVSQKVGTLLPQRLPALMKKHGLMP